jgi:hypothetical protein
MEKSFAISAGKNICHSGDNFVSVMLLFQVGLKTLSLVLVAASGSASGSFSQKKKIKHGEGCLPAMF